MKKAKDYYEQYKLAMLNDDMIVDAIRDLIGDLNLEVKELQEVRHVKFDRAIYPILKEMNQKWNAIVRLFEKEYGVSPIKTDGYKIYWINKIPRLEGKI